MKVIKETLKERNREFRKAKKAEKRVMIAQDVLAQIKARRYEPAIGNWVDFSTGVNRGSGVCLQEAFETKAIDTCKVCGVGSLIMSAINCGNSVTENEDDPEFGYASNGTLRRLSYDSIGKVSSSLEKYFSKDQIRLIELAFELGGGYFFTEEEIDVRAVKFGKKYTSAKGRLKAIMENIIANQGKFTP